MAVRPAREEDRVALSALDRRCWTLETNPILPDGEAWLEDETELDGVLVAEDARGVIGYVRIGNALPDHLFSAAHSARLRGIAVAPEARGTGLGALLLREVQELARARGYKKLVLQVLATNLHAQRFYERAGFVCEGRITGLFLLNDQFVDDLWYAKWL